MKVAVDSNILISAVIFNSAICKKIIKYISLSDAFVLTEAIIEETLNTTFKKFSSDAIKHLANRRRQTNNLDKMYDTILSASTSIYLSHHKDKQKFRHKIRHNNDQVILNSLLTSEVDIFITGDQDFFERSYPNLKIMTPAEFATIFIPMN